MKPQTTSSCHFCEHQNKSFIIACSSGFGSIRIITVTNHHHESLHTYKHIIFSFFPLMLSFLSLFFFKVITEQCFWVRCVCLYGVKPTDKITQAAGSITTMMTGSCTNIAHKWTSSEKWKRREFRKKMKWPYLHDGSSRRYKTITWRQAELLDLSLSSYLVIKTYEKEYLKSLL